MAFLIAPPSVDWVLVVQILKTLKTVSCVQYLMPCAHVSVRKLVSKTTQESPKESKMRLFVHYKLYFIDDIVRFTLK